MELLDVEEGSVSPRPMHMNGTMAQIGATIILLLETFVFRFKSLQTMLCFLGSAISALNMRGDFDFDSDFLPSNLPFYARSKYDPDVILSSLTGGSFYFGRTQTQNRRDGIILMSVGGTVTVLVILGIACVVQTCIGSFVNHRGHKQVIDEPTAPPELPYEHTNAGHATEQFPDSSPFSTPYVPRPPREVEYEPVTKTRDSINQREFEPPLYNA